MIWWNWVCEKHSKALSTGALTVQSCVFGQWPVPAAGPSAVSLRTLLTTAQRARDSNVTFN